MFTLAHICVHISTDLPTASKQQASQNNMHKGEKRQKKKKDFVTSIYRLENYLLLHIPRGLRVALAKFRVGNHDLEIEKGRYHM